LVEASAFKLQAITLYPGHPERCMALVCESHSADGVGNWVKKDSMVGPWLVREIRKGMVVVRNGEQVREVLVERSPLERTLVRDVRPASRVSLVQEQEESGPILEGGEPPPVPGDGVDVNEGK
jgi:hypothetical protein